MNQDVSQPTDAKHRCQAFLRRFAAQPAIAADAATRRQDRGDFVRQNQLERYLDLEVRRS